MMNAKPQSSYGDDRGHITFVLLRHAFAPFDRSTEAGANPELSNLGRRQAIAAGKALAEDRPTHVVASSLTRAKQTAQLLGFSPDLRAEHAAWLAEIRYPLWTGWPDEDILAALKEARRRPFPERWAGYEPEGESTIAFVSRVEAGFKEYLRSVHGLTTSTEVPLFQSTSNERRFVVVVGHAGSLPGVFRVLLGIPPTPWPWELMRLAHGSITRIESTPAGAGQIAFGIRSLSETSHLAEGDVTW